MRRSRVCLSLLVTFLLIGSTEASAQIPAGEIEIVRPKAYRPLEPAKSERISKIVETAAAAAVSSGKFEGLTKDQFAVTLIDLTGEPEWADHRGEAMMYPASVPKMFYLVNIHQQIADGKLTTTPEFERGVRDMIVDSSNDATQYIVDVLTQTASGGEMPAKEFELWSYRRNRMNRYFTSLGYRNINVNQKTYCEDAYGVEQQFRNYKGNNRNMLTSNASARLIAEIATGRAVNESQSKLMMETLKREPFPAGKSVDSQSVDFSGAALIERKLTGARLWSKAGWVSRQRHDAAYIELPTGQKFAIAVFTENRSNDKDLIPFIVGSVIDQLSKK